MAEYREVEVVYVVTSWIEVAYVKSSWTLRAPVASVAATARPVVH